MNKELKMIFERVEAVRDVASRADEAGIVAWAKRALIDAQILGRLRTKDAATLTRLEEVFNNDFYREYRTVARDECERELAIA